MKPNKILFILIAILVIDCSSYSQLSGAVLGKYKNAYVTSVSYGVARQFSDIPSAGDGWGTNIAIGKILYYEEDKALSFDLMGNLFFNSTKGLELNEVSRPFANQVLENSDYDLFYMNHKTSMFGIGLDGKLTYNKHRSLQRWYAAFLLGGNWGIYSVKMNMQDTEGNSYATQFEQIKNLKRDEKKRQLKELLDNKYESSAEGFESYPFRSTLMPSVGLEFGYDITRFLTIFVANKLYLSASNRIDGEVRVDDKKDMLNYLSLGLNVYFGKRFGAMPALMKYEDVPASRPASRPVHGYEIPKEVESYDFPEVKIIIPEERSFVSEEKLINVKARISNISSALDVYCKVNEDIVEFDYSRNFVTFTAELQNGENRIQVYGKNDQGQSRDVITVYYYGAGVSLPVVNLTEPAEAKFKSPDEIITIRAIVENVSDNENIGILANGYPMKNFVFNPATSEFRLRVRLAEGVNSFELKAANEAGTVSKEFDIYYNVEIPDDDITGLPDIVIISPGPGQPLSDSNDFIDFKASVNGVSNRNAVLMTINGKPNDRFSYDQLTGLISDRITLSPGETIISIVASNIFGESSNEVRVLYEEPKIDAASSLIEFNEVTDPDEFCNTNITVTVRGAVHRNDVKLFLNQLEIRNFAFTGTTHTLRSSLFLDQGNNVIEVTYNNRGTIENEFYFIRCTTDTIPGEGEDGFISGVDTISIPLPEIRESFPLDFSKVETENITFRANIAHIISKDNIRIWHNDEPVLSFDYSEDFRELRAEMTLTEGVNKIEVKAKNETGEISKVIIVSYEEPLAGPPVIVVNSPRNGFSTEDNSTVFRATIQNIKKVEDVLVTMNGAIFSDYNFDENRGIVFGYVPLRLGENKLAVEAVNRLGSDSEEVVFYSRKEHLPAARIVSPRSGVIMSMAFVPLEAIVQNVKRSNDATITVNGVLHRSVRLDNEKLTSNVPIKRGENTIILRVVNDHGSAFDTIRVSYEGPPEPPVITFLNPAASGTIVNTSTLKFEAQVDGIRHSSNVELLLNGQQIEGLRFFRNENKITADLKLSKGMNIIMIKATNDTGIDEKSLRVDRQ